MTRSHKQSQGALKSAKLLIDLEVYNNLINGLPDQKRQVMLHSHQAIFGKRNAGG